MFYFIFSWRIDRLEIKKEYRVMIYLHPDVKDGGHPEAIPTQTESNPDRQKG